MLITEDVRRTSATGFSRQEMLRILAVCHQGARSIDAVLHASQSNWTALRRYYGDAGREEWIKAARADLGSGDLPDKPRTIMHADSAPQRRGSFISDWITFIANQWRKRWFLPDEVHTLVRGALDRLAALLPSHEQPPLDDLVRLRLDLTTAASYFDRLLCGLSEVNAIQDVEYYAPPAGKELLPVGNWLRRFEKAG